VNDHIAPELVIAWVDGHLEGEAAEKVRLHLETCPECRQAAEAVRELSEAVQAAVPSRGRFPSATIPPALEKKLTQSARKHCADRDRQEAPIRDRSGTRRKRSLRPLVWPLVAVAAGIVIILTVLFVPGENRLSLDITLRDPALYDQDTYRGMHATQYYLDIVLPGKGFFYILDLDGTGELSCIFPFVDDSGTDDFGLVGPFGQADTIRVPPADSYEGYELKDDRLFVLFTDSRLSEQSLRDLLKEIEKDVLDDRESIDTQAERVLEWLTKRYPETLLRRHGSE